MIVFMRVIVVVMVVLVMMMVPMRMVMVMIMLVMMQALPPAGAARVFAEHQRLDGHRHGV